MKHMIKIVVHAPKGGVGKTTIATNISLHLARQGRAVWALDLAQGGFMSAFLKRSPEFASTSNNKIETRELGELPETFSGSSKFDYVVADTDDYYKVYSNLLEMNRRDWRVIVPIVPSDENGLLRIPQETATFMRGAYLTQGLRPTLHVVMNKCAPGESDVSYNVVAEAMERQGAVSWLSKVWIPSGDSASHPFFINDNRFKESIKQLLNEIGAGE